MTRGLADQLVQLRLNEPGVPVLSESERFVRQVTIESHIQGVRGEGGAAKGEGDELTS